MSRFTNLFVKHVQTFFDLFLLLVFSSFTPFSASITADQVGFGCTFFSHILNVLRRHILLSFWLSAAILSNSFSSTPIHSPMKYHLLAMGKRNRTSSFNVGSTSKFNIMPVIHKIMRHHLIITCITYDFS